MFISFTVVTCRKLQENSFISAVTTCAHLDSIVVAFRCYSLTCSTAVALYIFGTFYLWTYAEQRRPSARYDEAPLVYSIICVV